MPRSLRPYFRWLLAVLVGFVGVLVFASPASAHADLTSSDPADGSIVESAPNAITLNYTEGVTVRADGVRVIDSNGDRVDAATATASGSTITAPLTGDVGQGTFVVAWRAVSADGHPVRGAFTFSVGQESEVGSGVADRAFGSGDDEVYERLGAVLRVVAYVATLGACGFVLVAAGLRRRDDPSPMGRWTTIASLTGLASVLGLVVVQGALTTGTGLKAITQPGVASLALSDGIGLATLITAVGLLAVMLTAGLPFEDVAARLAVAGAVLAPLGFVVAGHTRSMSPALVAYAADFAHLAAAAIWFGGLIALVVVSRWRRHQDDPFGAAEAVARYSGWAGWAAAVVAVSGVMLAWIEVGGLKALTTTTYGRLLMAKLVAVAVVVALAAWNRFRLLPSVAAGAIEDPPLATEPAWTRLRSSLRAEIVLLTLVLALTGVIVAVTPAKAAVEAGLYSTTAPLGEGSVDVTVDPAQVGRNDAHIYILDADGRPDDSYDTPTLRLELPDQGMGPFDREPIKVGPGHYQLVGTELPLAGNWTITITVKPDRFTEQSALVEFPVA